MEALDPQSYQTREVYAHYGLAMYLANCVEQAIFQNLIFFDHFPTATKTVRDAESWTREFDAFEGRELGRTMGMLIKRLKEAGQTTTTIEERLSEVLAKRNFLAHHYFAQRAVEFTLDDGRSSMIEELQVIQGLFREAEELIMDVTRPAAIKYGLTDKVLERVTAELVEAHRQQQAEQGAP